MTFIASRCSDLFVEESHPLMCFERCSNTCSRATGSLFFNGNQNGFQRFRAWKHNQRIMTLNECFIVETFACVPNKYRVQAIPFTLRSTF